MSALGSVRQKPGLPGKAIFIKSGQCLSLPCHGSPGVILAADRTIRFLCALEGATTSRVLNLRHIAQIHGRDPEYGEKPLFTSPVINTAFVLKHRIRTDEDYLFSSSRAAGTKIIVPFDLQDLRAGGPSFFVDQRGFVELLRQAGHYSEGTLERDIRVLRLLNAIPSLDPFLLREHLRSHNIEVAACYFAISAGDQNRMHAFVAGELSRLVRLANGEDTDGSTSRMVSAMLSGEVNERLEPLRITLGLSEGDFREGAFGWRGFLYYKWQMQSVWPQVMDILREIKAAMPEGAVSDQQRTLLAALKRSIIELVRDNSHHITKVLDVYDESFADLVASSAPKTFRDFLLSAPSLFLELGDKMGAISHIASFWRYRFPKDRPQLRPAMVDAEELIAIFQDFASGFAERSRETGSPLARPAMIKA